MMPDAVAEISAAVFFYRYSHFKYFNQSEKLYIVLLFLPKRKNLYYTKIVYC